MTTRLLPGRATLKPTLNAALILAAILAAALILGMIPVVFLAGAAPAANSGQALEAFDSGNYERAALLLDTLAEDEPDPYRSNNLHYLRGRIAESQGDWARASQEFNRVGAGSVLYDLAVWRLARVALAAGHPDDAREAIGWLPDDFPADLQMELADLAPEPLALGIYRELTTREARLERALLENDVERLWDLLRANQNDDIAVRAAARLFDPTLDPDDRIFLGRIYAAHRTFDLAEAMFLSLVQDDEHAAEAHYALGRIYFQLTRYDDALGWYRATMLQFPASDEAERAESQLAPTYWRKLDFGSAAAAYLEAIRKADGTPAAFHAAIRDLVDVYRAQGDTDSALTWIARGIANRPPAPDRAVLVFTRAKVQYLRTDFESALASLRELGGMTLRAVPNGTDLEEVRFLEGLALEKLGRLDEARRIWADLSRTPFSYYGSRALRKLGPGPGTAIDRDLEACRRDPWGPAVEHVRVRRAASARPWSPEGGESSRVGELVFLHLWDEAFYWANREASRYPDQTLADLALLAGRYRQAMLYADRLRKGTPDEIFASLGSGDPESEVLVSMLYPAAFADIICREAGEAAADPLWLRSIMWQESRYDPRARSGAIARGLMQFIPETAVAVGVSAGLGDLDVTHSLYDPEVSIRLGAFYWASLMAEFDSPEMALASYNGGPHNVRRWRAKSGGTDPELFVADIGFVETKDYVRRVFELYARYTYLQTPPSRSAED